MIVPYYIGDLKRDPKLENYPYRLKACGFDPSSRLEVNRLT